MKHLLLELLKDPALSASFSAADWDLVIPQARSCGLLATLYLLIEDSGLLSNIPGGPHNHLHTGMVSHRRQVESLAWEVRWLLKALSPVDVPLVLLKGAAYLRAGLMAGQGRRIGDIDILVPRERLAEVERSLNAAGWVGESKDAYDEHYYRQWMHEIPPMAHARRGSTVDVHHAIVPPTANPATDAGLLFHGLREVASGVYTLSPADMVLHSATHLFHEGEFHNGFRDILDLDRLLRAFAESEPGFWEELLRRADELNLKKSLFYGMRYAHRIFCTPIPEWVLAKSKRHYRGKILIPLMDMLYLRALVPDHPSCYSRLSGCARFSLYVRSHYIRMPLVLLFPHLLRKAWKRRSDRATSSGEAAGNNFPRDQ